MRQENYIILEYTRCAWAEGTCANYPDYLENHQFHVITVLLLHMYFFEEFLIHNESIGPVPFSAEYLICRHVQTDRQTDGGQTN